MASQRGNIFSGVGRSPRDRTRTRRVLQRLRDLGLAADGESIIVDPDGTLRVNVQGVLSIDANGVKLGLGEAFENTASELTLRPRDASLFTDTGGVGVQLAPGGGIGLEAGGLKVVGGIPITTEQPSGAQDGTNTAFALANPPQAGEVLVFTNGQLMLDDPAGDYTRSGTDITFVAAQAPLPGDVLQAVYLEGQGAAGEAPAGTVNGTNDTFTLANDPEDTSLMLFANGQLLTRGGSADYTLSENTITFNADSIPVIGDRIFAVYELESP